MLISNLDAGDGTISATVEFAEVSQQTVCELVFNYSAETKGHFAAGLGGGWSAFSIREWVQATAGSTEPSRWNALEGVGDRRNLRAHKPYRIKVTVVGYRVTLTIDGFHVVSTLLQRPLPQRAQVGLFCLGLSDTTIRDFAVATTASTAFVVMQFSSPFNEIYSDVIKQACKDYKLRPIRADEMYGPGSIIRDITDQIVAAQVIIADVTPANQNVYFEVGYAHGVQKPCILLSEKNSKLPFDLSGFRTLFYENTIAGRAQFDDGLRRHLAAITGLAPPAPKQ